MTKTISKKVVNKSSTNLKPAQNTNDNDIEKATTDVIGSSVDLLKIKSIRGFTNEVIRGVSQDISNGVSDIEIMQTYNLSRVKFKNLIFELACAGFDVSNLNKSARKRFLRPFRCNVQGIIITQARLKRNDINVCDGDSLDLIRIDDTSFMIKIIK